MTDWDALRDAERRAAVRAVAAVLGLLLLVSLGSVWLTYTGGSDDRPVLGVGLGAHAAERDGSPVSAALSWLPPLLVTATAGAAALVAGDPRRRRCQVLAGLGAVTTGLLLLVLLGISVDDDLVGGGTGLTLALVAGAAAVALGVRAGSQHLDRHRAPRR